jgi:hypothetical protein
MTAAGFFPRAKKITKKWTSRVNRRAHRGVINEQLDAPVEIPVRARKTFIYGDEF